MIRLLGHSARLVPIAFLLAILLGTGLLMLPQSSASGAGTGFLIAVFTATSAVCVTGLTVVDTATHWSGFGRSVILLLFQVDGFGIMSGATLLGMLVAQRLRLGTRLVAQAETRSLALGDVGAVLRLVLLTTVAVEASIALGLAVRLCMTLDMPWPEAAWHGLFHTVSAFNNAGSSTFSDNLVGFARDPVVLGLIAAAVVTRSVATHRAEPADITVARVFTRYHQQHGQHLIGAASQRANLAMMLHHLPEGIRHAPEGIRHAAVQRCC